MNDRIIILLLLAFILLVIIAVIIIFSQDNKNNNKNKEKKELKEKYFEIIFHYKNISMLTKTKFTEQKYNHLLRYKNSKFTLANFITTNNYYEYKYFTIHKKIPKFIKHRGNDEVFKELIDNPEWHKHHIRIESKDFDKYSLKEVLDISNNTEKDLLNNQLELNFCCN
jgi:hypothetical protein